MGSKSGAPEPKLAEGISPIDPTSAAAASLKNIAEHIGGQH
jgi:hypothetical protein